MNFIKTSLIFATVFTGLFSTAFAAQFVDEEATCPPATDIQQADLYNNLIQMTPGLLLNPAFAVSGRTQGNPGWDINLFLSAKDKETAKALALEEIMSVNGPEFPKPIFYRCRYITASGFKVVAISPN